MSTREFLTRPSARLLDMEGELAKELPDHPHVVSLVARIIRRKIALLAEYPWALARLLCIGPIEPALRLAIGLARFLYEEELAVVYLDMAAYAEKHQVAALLTRPGGMVCATVAGDLTEPVLRRPEMVLVLGGVEQAHTDVWKTLLPILRDGEIVDGLGQRVAFKHTVIILTTIVGANRGLVSPSYEVGPDCRVMAARVPDEMRQAIEMQFAPEILHTFDDMLYLGE